jgi:hypothetical protein
MRADQDPLVLQAKITIADIKPSIWRRLLLPRDLNFAQLHEVIQAAFGWTDSHLHQFIVGGLVIGAPEFDEDRLSNHQTFEATKVFLHDLDLYHMPNPRILYEYDFGDSWEHWIEIENQVPRQDGVTYPLCTDGARHRPPEDVGGAGGYANFLEAWHDPDHDDHLAMRQWAGRSFEPETFDIIKVNKAIASALRRCRKNYRFRRDR